MKALIFNLNLIVLYCLILLTLLISFEVNAQSINTSTLNKWQSDLESNVPSIAKKASLNLYFYWLRHEEAYKAFEAREKYWCSIASVDSLKNNYIHLALILSRICQNKLELLDSSKYYLDIAIDLLSEDCDSILLGRAYTFRGLYYKKIGYSKTAMQWYIRSLKIKEAIGYNAGLGYTYNLIGKLYEDQGLYQVSLENYKKAIHYAELDGKYDRALYIKNMGSVYIKMNEKNKALDCLLEALSIVQKRKKNSIIKSMIHSSLGDFYLHFHQPDKAILHINKALELKQYQQNHSSITNTIVQLAKCHIAKHEIEKAHHFINKAVTRTKRSPNPRPMSVMSAYETQSVILGIKGNHKMALKAYQNYIAVRDSIKSIETRAKIFELEQLYTHEKSENKIIQLENQRAQDTKKLKIEKTNRNYLLAFSIFLLIVFGIIVYLFSRLKTKNKFLRRALEERKLLIREIHHRVKNNLQMISSMLYLQSKNLHLPEENMTIGILNDMRSRIKSMALVHQKLYLEKDFGVVDVKLYTDDLLQNIFSSLENKNGLKNMEIDIEPLQMDIDTIIPIGMILNELITNAFKHAFVNQINPKVKVSLKKQEGILLLNVSDNGKIPSQKVSAYKTDSFGINLIYAIAESLDANIDITNKKGREICIRINRFKLYP